MMRLTRPGLISALVLAIAAPVLAQQPADPRGTPAPLDRGYVTVLGGAATVAETAATLAAEYGERILPNVQAYATLSYFDNLINDTAQDDLVAVADALAAVTDTSWQLRGRDRGLALILGAKFLVPGDTFRPYIGGGVGALNLKRTIIEQTRGNISDAFAAELGFADGILNTGQTATTNPIVEGAAGVAIHAGRAYVDVGYRVRRTFHMAEPLQFSQFVVGLGMRF